MGGVRAGRGVGARLLAVALLVAVALDLGGARGARAQEADYAIGASVAVAAETLSYRVAPSLDADIILLLPEGTRGTLTDGPVLADGWTWYEFSTAGYGPDGATPGWVAGEFLTPAGDGFPAGSGVMVQLDGLNLRDTPGLGGAVIAALPLGLTLTLLTGPSDADGYRWYEVQTVDVALRGWVAGEFLIAPPPEVNFAPGDTVIVASPDLNLRERPGLDAPIRAVLALGIAAQIIGGPVSADGQEWYRIATDTADGNGWAVGTYLANP